jgi:hypothetical protein
MDKVFLVIRGERRYIHEMPYNHLRNMIRWYERHNMTDIKRAGNRAGYQDLLNELSRRSLKANDQRMRQIRLWSLY